MPGTGAQTEGVEHPGTKAPNLKPRPPQSSAEGRKVLLSGVPARPEGECPPEGKTRGSDAARERRPRDGGLPNPCLTDEVRQEGPDRLKAKRVGQHS